MKVPASIRLPTSPTTCREARLQLIQPAITTSRACRFLKLVPPSPSLCKLSSTSTQKLKFSSLCLHNARASHVKSPRSSQTEPFRWEPPQRLGYSEEDSEWLNARASPNDYNANDPTSNSLGSHDNKHLDGVAEEFRSRFSPSKLDTAEEGLPTVADLEQLRPPRLRIYLTGMSRGYHSDQFASTVKRISRAFSKTQLQTLVQSLSYDDLPIKVLSKAGNAELAKKRRAGDKRTIGRLRWAVIGQGNPGLYTLQKPLPLAMEKGISKSRLAEWIVVEHWGITHPDAIQGPPSLAELARRQRAGEDLFTLPYHELFLLSLDQEKTGKPPLASLCHRHSVKAQISTSPPGLRVKGTVSDRDSFRIDLEYARRKCVSRTVTLPSTLDEAGVVSPAWCRSVGEIAMAYVERPVGDQAQLLVHAYEVANLDAVERAVAESLALYQTSHAIPIFVSPSQCGGDSRSNSNATLLPFVSRSLPPWHITGAERLGRFRSSELTQTTLMPPTCQTPLPLVCLKGDVEDVDAWLLEIQPMDGMGDIHLKATFGHCVFTRQSKDSHVGPSFPMSTKDAQFSQWIKHQSTTPAFLASPQSSILLPASHSSQGDGIMANSTCHIHMFSEVGNKRSNTQEFFKITSIKDVVMIQRILQRSLTLMLPSRSLDVLITAQRISASAIDDPTNGAYSPGALSFNYEGRQFIRSDYFLSQHIDSSEILPTASASIPPFVKVRHERRKDFRLINSETSLQAELVATLEQTNTEEFLRLACHLAALPYHPDAAAQR